MLVCCVEGFLSARSIKTPHTYSLLKEYGQNYTTHFAYLKFAEWLLVYLLMLFWVSLNRVMFCLCSALALPPLVILAQLATPIRDHMAIAQNSWHLNVLEARLLKLAQSFPLKDLGPRIYV